MKDEPAFPHNHISPQGDVILCGLTKRELFSIMALQGLLARPTNESIRLIAQGTKDAVKYADALIAELEKK